MTNYDKKRNRKIRKQLVISESERQIIYRQAFYDAQQEVIERMTNAGILPRLDFKMVPKTMEDFKKDYPNE